MSKTVMMVRDRHSEICAAYDIAKSSLELLGGFFQKQGGDKPRMAVERIEERLTDVWLAWFEEQERIG
jgi:hypothetical protein